MSLMGRAIGILAGFAGARILGHFTGWSTVVSVPTVFLALAFSASVGIFFGFYPKRYAVSHSVHCGVRAPDGSGRASLAGTLEAALGKVRGARHSRHSPCGRNCSM